MEIAPVNERTYEEQLRWESLWSLKSTLSHLRAQYGIRARVGRARVLDARSVTFQAWEMTEFAEEATAVLGQELTKYPPEFISFCGIRQIRLARKIFLKKPEYWTGVKNVGGVSTENGPIYIAGSERRITHHELVHKADQRAGTLLPGKIRKWKRLNRRHPYLGELYWSMNPKEAEQLPYDGYANPYGRVNIKEDRATIGEQLMMNSEALLERANDSFILSDKIRRLKADYKIWSNGRMNEQFFEDLAAGKVTEGYWQ